MRTKIIVAHGVIVLLVGLLGFALVRAQLLNEMTHPEVLGKRAQRDVASAVAQVQLDALRAERWLSGQANEPVTRAVIAMAAASARGDAARDYADRLTLAAAEALKTKPALAFVVDPAGKVLGRSGSTLGRGDDLAAAYPAFRVALSRGQSGSDVWHDAARAHHFVVSYVPVFGDRGLAGMIVLGTGLNEALSRAEELTVSADGNADSNAGGSGGGNAAGGADASARGRANASEGLVLTDAAGNILASSAGVSEATRTAIGAMKLNGEAFRTSAQAVVRASEALTVAVLPLTAFGTPSLADEAPLLVAVAPATLMRGIDGVAASVLGAAAVGLVLVFIAGASLGRYVSEPIAELEEGLLSVLNGQVDKRFELEHAELGGLAFRIDQLVRALTDARDAAEPDSELRAESHEHKHDHDDDERNPTDDSPA